MSQLPSYQEAISRLDWLELVAPYVEYRDFVSLCSVNRRFNAVFAPRLWNDPLVIVRQLGIIDPSDDLDWYLTFVFDRLQTVIRPSTRAFITTLDFRDFAKDSAHFSSSDNNRTISESLRLLQKVTPNVRCVLLDGHAEADPAFLTALTPPSGAAAGADGSQDHDQHHLLVLSMAHCVTQLPSAFFMSDKLQHLVCLDVSGLPGSLQPLLAARRRHLAHLKILKARRREINDGLAIQLFQAFKSTLWSLDISENKVTDAVLDDLAALCFSSPSLRSHSRLMTEGKLTADGHGNDSHGRFMSIQESDWSGTFRHPERHLVDAPVYSVDPTRGLQEDEAVRSNGKGPLKRDTVDHVKAAVAGSMDRPVPDWSGVPHLDVCTAPAGITHLHLSDTHITSAGVERLIRSSQGQLEEFSCEGLLFQPVQLLETKQSVPWAKGVRLHGILGCSHVFRPVYSSNIRVLRVHHSLVTQILTLQGEGLGLSAIDRLWIAETAIRERSELAFPQGFEPDMNPRLVSLTLTNIPRRSSGPLISKLIHFLKLAGLQERDIKTGSASYQRGPTFLSGLRRIRLEFEADPGFSTSELDAEGLMDMGKDFSFFPQDNMSKVEDTARLAPAVQPPIANLPPVNRACDMYPFSDFDGEYMDYSGDTWAGRPFDRKVWIGPGLIKNVQHSKDSVTNNQATREYSKLATYPFLRARVGPASPDHIKAGVPSGSLLFHAAWDAIVMPSKEDLRPSAEGLRGMRDVLDAIKAYRLQTRTAQTAAVGDVDGDGQNFFWSGRLEVSIPSDAE